MSEASKPEEAAERHERPVQGVVMRDEALKWRVRFETPDGMYTFTDIKKNGGFKLGRAEVEEWAEVQVRANPNRYAKVAAVLNLDGDGAAPLHRLELLVMRKLARKAFGSFWVKHFLCKYQWYRKWYGGRWEYHWIEICGSRMWLDMTPPHVWPEYRQPCSHGTPIVEDW